MADTITILNGLDHEQDQTTSIIYDIDDANNECVGMYPIGRTGQDKASLL